MTRRQRRPFASLRLRHQRTSCHLGGFARSSVPASTTGCRRSRHGPDGVFLSNGPGNTARGPSAVTRSAALGAVPIFGSASSTLLGLAMAPATVSSFRDHGGTPPVRNVTGRSNQSRTTTSRRRRRPQRRRRDDALHLTRGLRGEQVAGERASCSAPPEPGRTANDSRYLFARGSRRCSRRVLA